MERFDIREFEPLDEASLPDVIKKLQAVRGAEWGDDPMRDLQRLRNGGGKAVN